MALNILAEASAQARAKLPGNRRDVEHDTAAFNGSVTAQEVLYTWPDGKTDKAIYHEHIRAELLHQAEATCSWLHPQPHGTAPDDRTAPTLYPSDQLTWGFSDRLHYPPINFVLERRGYDHPKYMVLHLYHNGLLVLDLDDKPIKDFRHLPLTISSRIPGGHIEALMRFDDRVTYADIRSRMPTKILVHRNGKASERQLQKVGALGAAAARWREMAGCLNWHDRLGSKTLNDYILANVPKELKARNTTRGWRNLTKAEIAALRAPAIGSRPQQARKRATSAEAREKRQDSIKKRKTKAVAASMKIPKITAPTSGYEKPFATFSDSPNDGDCRKRVPRNDEERAILQTALKPSVMELISILGVEPVKNHHLCYKDQISHLQSQLNELYRELKRSQAKPPTLVRLTSWSGGIRNWRTATFWDGEKYYEINRQGKVGALIQSQGNTEAPEARTEAQQRMEQEEALQAERYFQAEEHGERIDDSDGDATVALDADETESEHSSNESSDDEPPSAGSYLVDARGNYIHPNRYPAAPADSPPPTLPSTDHANISGIHEDDPVGENSASPYTAGTYDPHGPFDLDGGADKENEYDGVAGPRAIARGDVVGRESLGVLWEEEEEEED